MTLNYKKENDPLNTSYSSNPKTIKRPNTKLNFEKFIKLKWNETHIFKVYWYLNKVNATLT